MEIEPSSDTPTLIQLNLQVCRIRTLRQHVCGLAGHNIGTWARTIYTQNYMSNMPPQSDHQWVERSP